MSITIQDVFEKRKNLKEELLELDSVIKSYQKICDHEWEYDGHDSHYSYNKCKLCSLIERVNNNNTL